MCESLLSEGDRWRYELGTDTECKGNQIPNSYSVSSRNLCFTIYGLFVCLFVCFRILDVSLEVTGIHLISIRKEI